MSKPDPQHCLTPQRLYLYSVQWLWEKQQSVFAKVDTFYMDPIPMSVNRIRNTAWHRSAVIKDIYIYIYILTPANYCSTLPRRYKRIISPFNVHWIYISVCTIFIVLFTKIPGLYTATLFITVATLWKNIYPSVQSSLNLAKDKLSDQSRHLDSDAIFVYRIRHTTNRLATVIKEFIFLEHCSLNLGKTAKLSGQSRYFLLGSGSLVWKPDPQHCLTPPRRWV